MGEELEEKERRLEEKERQLRSTRARLEKEVRELDQWSRDLERREADIQSLQENVVAFESDKRQWEDDKAHILEELKRYEEELREKDRSLENRKDRLSSIEERLMEAVGVAEDVEKRSLDLEDERIRFEEEEGRIRSLREDLEKRLMDTENRERALAREGERIAGLEMDLEEMKDENMRLRQDMEELGSRHHDLEERYLSAKGTAVENRDLREALYRTEEERDALRKKMDEGGRGRDLKVIHDLKEKVLALEGELRLKDAENNRRLGDLARLEREVRELKDSQTSNKEEESTDESSPHGDRVAYNTNKPASLIESPLTEDSGSIPVEKGASLQARRTSESETWYQKGKALMKKGNHKPAILCFDHALKDAVEDAEILLAKARALYASNRHVHASRVLNVLSSVSPEDADVWELKAMNLYKLHHDTDALEAFERSIEIEKRPSTLKIASRILQKKGRLENAIDYIDHALRFDPGDKQSWKMKSSILSDMGLHREAGEALMNCRGQMNR